jgi:hypothetical protein
MVYLSFRSLKIETINNFIYEKNIIRIGFINLFNFKH